MVALLPVSASRSLFISRSSWRNSSLIVASSGSLSCMRSPSRSHPAWSTQELEARATHDARTPGLGVSDVVGRIVQTGANHAPVHQPDTGLSSAWPADLDARA